MGTMIDDSLLTTESTENTEKNKKMNISNVEREKLGLGIRF